MNPAASPGSVKLTKALIRSGFERGKCHLSSNRKHFSFPNSFILNVEERILDLISMHVPDDAQEFQGDLSNFSFDVSAMRTNRMLHFVIIKESLASNTFHVILFDSVIVTESYMEFDQIMTVKILARAWRESL
jgi:hypothetical protein